MMVLLVVGEWVDGDRYPYAAVLQCVPRLSLVSFFSFSGAIKLTYVIGMALIEQMCWTER